MKRERIRLATKAAGVGEPLYQTKSERITHYSYGTYRIDAVSKLIFNAVLVIIAFLS